MRYLTLNFDLDISKVIVNFCIDVEHPSVPNFMKIELLLFEKLQRSYRTKQNDNERTNEQTNQPTNSHDHNTSWRILNERQNIIKVIKSNKSNNSYLYKYYGNINNKKS